MLSTRDDDDLGAAARSELVSSTLANSPVRLVLGLLDAVALGRQGRRDEATALAAQSIADINATAVFGGAHLMLRLAAEAAIRDGWGDPVPWLRSGEAFFAERGFDKVARACRTLLRTAGAPMPRRGRGDSPVPAGLRASGITSREMDVLKLIAAGCRTGRSPSGCTCRRAPWNTT